jgi:acetylornithine deacetylase/succinyl-diaminopimelate desuccinylase-like protein
MKILRQLIALPTVSGSPALESAAKLLQQELTAIGMHDCRLLRAKPGAPPSVWAQRHDNPGSPCLLLYGHFDVQPPGSQAWQRAPFSGALEAGRIHGRGASDNKGPLVCLLAGLESHLATAGRLPVNVRVWLEGEEERGSPHLRSFLDRYGALLRADAIALSDSTRLGGTDRPTLVTGLRGMLDIGLTVAGPAHELHSGAFGGEVLDPAMVLSHLVSSLCDADGRVRVPGFYQAVRRPTDDERLQNSAVGIRRRALAESAGVAVSDLRGEYGWSPGTRSTLRPSLTVIGMSTGRTDSSAVAAIATSADARVNIRLVPDQHPNDIAIRLNDHFSRVAPPGARFRMKVLARAHPVLVEPGQSVATALRRALWSTWGRRPLVIRNGGTIPIVAELNRRYGMPAAMWGLSGPDDRIHAAGESIAVRDLHRGVEVVTRLLQEAAR